MNKLDKVLKDMADREVCRILAVDRNYPKMHLKLHEVEHLFNGTASKLSPEILEWMANKELRLHHDITHYCFGDDVTFYFMDADVAVEFKLTFL